jgi:hypothetical protein
VLHQALGHDRGHHLSGVMRPLAPAVAQREGERIGEVFGAGGREEVGVGMSRGYRASANKTRTARGRAWGSGRPRNEDRASLGGRGTVTGKSELCAAKIGNVPSDLGQRKVKARRAREG